jgi:hypothetical protein
MGKFNKNKVRSKPLEIVPQENKIEEVVLPASRKSDDEPLKKVRMRLTNFKFLE